MMLPTHIVTTAATTAYLLNRWNVNNKWLYALGFVAGAIPDFDLLYYMAFKKRKNTIFTADAVNHRQTIMHAPLFYMAVLLPLSAIAYFGHITLLYQIVVLLSVGVFSHILMDMVWVGGVPLLWPFHKDMHGFFLKSSQRMMQRYMKAHGNDWMGFYMHHPLFYMEGVFLLFMLMNNYVPQNIVLGSIAAMAIPSLIIQAKQRKLKRELSEAI